MRTCVHHGADPRSNAAGCYHKASSGCTHWASHCRGESRMKLRISLVAALAALLSVTTTPQWSSAQSRTTSIYNNNVRLAQAEDLPSRLGGAPAQATPGPVNSQGDV